MRKSILALATVLFCSNLLAQAPQLMSYQAVVRNGSNQLLSNAPVGTRISVLQGSANGNAVYSETHSVMTNAQGLATLSIGGGTPQNGTFAGIDWANGPYFLKAETDPAGGTNYSITATSQLMSVPYALYSAKAENGVPSGSQPGEILTNCNGVLTWTVGGECPGSIASLRCDSIIHQGTLYNGIAATMVSSTIIYSGGNGALIAGRKIKSIGVTGLSAEIATGYFADGPGSLPCIITGTPSSSGIASFTLKIGGQSCTLIRNVEAHPYPLGTIHCSSTPTAIVNVVNPTTGKIWMDRNLGASRAATSSTDADAYGDLYQWGRRADGHQCRNSATTSTLSTGDLPAHGNFILAPDQPLDWRSPQNDNLWQGVTGVNNPCPSTYRIPTSAELDAERTSWNSNNSTGTFSSPLKMPLAGLRFNYNGSISEVGFVGFYWSSTISGEYANHLYISSGYTGAIPNPRAYGISVRCIKN